MKPKITVKTVTFPEVLDHMLSDVKSINKLAEFDSLRIDGFSGSRSSECQTCNFGLFKRGVRCSSAYTESSLTV